MNLEDTLKSLAADAPEGLTGAVLAEVGLADRYAVHPGPIGDVFVAFNERGVTAVDLAESEDDFERRHLSTHGRPAVRVDDLPEVLARHVDNAIKEGRPGRLPVDLSGLTEFQQAVLRRAATIPRGEVRPYGWIAKEIGRPLAVRAVGSALARNPVPVIIPCHRVVRSDGTLGKYSLGADENKRVLLEMEGIDVDGLSNLAARGVRFVGSDTTHIFCHPTCRNARRITDAHRVEFHSEADAEHAGYRSCKVCRPAQAA
ncbi:MAG TPA: methylated-DNA--[protein]-cysteine S-methyltransferase [Acidimicrobiia bacterium]|nr:methylated-DNA--[protein]-cysteine S-methyltransferase [Acidimicrobiia bacterium]